MEVIKTREPYPPDLNAVLAPGPSRLVALNVVDSTMEFYMGPDVTLEDLLWWKQTLTHEINTIYAEEA